jgi:pyruvate-formate lyase
VLNSVAKVDNWLLKGLLLNMRLNPSVLQGEKGFWLWYNFMRTWEQKGIDHVQYNCVSTETLRAAQKEPEKYSDVIVRVAGYSARFIDLSKYSQDSIMAREEQSLGA